MPSKEPKNFSMIGPIPILRPNSPNCPHCGAGPEKQTVKNRNMLFGDGDVYCTVCGKKVRDFDSG